jgi:hypothetical protein
MSPEAFGFLILAGGQSGIGSQNQKPIAHLLLPMQVVPAGQLLVQGNQCPRGRHRGVHGLYHPQG